MNVAVGVALFSGAVTEAVAVALGVGVTVEVSGTCLVLCGEGVARG